MTETIRFVVLSGFEVELHEGPDEERIRVEWFPAWQQWNIAGSRANS
jgi:hypothetical protein